MKTRIILILMVLAALALSSCGAIPTLPPLDSTVTVWTPQPTDEIGDPDPTLQAAIFTMTPDVGEETTQPEPTSTLAPTSMPEPTATTELTLAPTATSTLEPTPTSTAVPFTLQMPDFYYLQAFTHPDLGCNWLGVAGQVFNKDGVVQKDLVIRAGGTINGLAVVEEMTMPLADQEVDQAYGPGGYEITLANGVADSADEVWVQVFSLEGDELSEQVFLTTFADCQKNLILLNFVED